MFQRDYIMRMIAQAAEAAGVILGLRRRQAHAEALRYLDDWLERNLRLKLVLIDRLSTEDLVKLHTTSGFLDTAALLAIARLLREAAAVAEAAGDEDTAYLRRLKSLELNMIASEERPDDAAIDPDDEIGALLTELADYELPAGTMRQLAVWCENGGRYDEAENWLCELLDTDRADSSLLHDFYHRLLKLPDERLAAGGLPREEVEAGLVELHVRRR